MKKTYPTAMACHAAVEKLLVPVDTFFDPETGHTEKRARYTVPGGLRITFRTYKGRFSYTELRNRPIQALAACCCMVAEKTMMAHILRT